VRLLTSLSSIAREKLQEDVAFTVLLSSDQITYLLRNAGYEPKRCVLSADRK